MHNLGRGAPMTQLPEEKEKNHLEPVLDRLILVFLRQNRF